MSIIILRSDCISLNVSLGLFLSLCSYFRAKENPSRQPQKSVTDLEHKVYLDFMLSNLIRQKIANYKSKFTTITHFCHYYPCL